MAAFAVITLVTFLILAGQRAQSVSNWDIVKFAVPASICFGLFFYAIEKYLIPYLLNRTARKIIKTFNAKQVGNKLYKTKLFDFDVFISQNLSISVNMQSSDLVSFFIPVNQLDSIDVKKKYRIHTRNIGNIPCYQVWQTNSMGIKV